MVMGRETARSPWLRGCRCWGVGGRDGGDHGPSPWPSPRPRVFFDSCDGIFTNYNWGEEHLVRMRGPAGERLADVYVGVDVFARGNVVGGRFDTNKVGGGPGGWGGGSGLPEAPLAVGRASPLPSRGRQAQLPFPDGKPRHQETSVTCPGAKLGPRGLAAAHLYGQMVRPLEVPGPCARSPLPSRAAQG